MNPSQIYDVLHRYVECRGAFICDLHSACSPEKGKKYRCLLPNSKVEVVDFDQVKIKADVEKSLESRKSVDAAVGSPSDTYFCFIELKSWGLLLAHKGTEKKIRKQAKKYSSDLPEKLLDSIKICKEVTNNDFIFDDCRIIYILLTDIPVRLKADKALYSIDSDLTALAGSSSNLNMLCNQLSQNIMDNIPRVETRYWECSEFDKEFSCL